MLEGMARDLYLENMQWLDQQLALGQIGQAEYDLKKARLIAGATRSTGSKIGSTVAIVLVVLIALVAAGWIFDQFGA